MITTFQDDEIVSHSFLLAPESRLWRRVVLELNTPYFLVKYQDRTADAWIDETAIFWELDAVLGFCAAYAQSSERRVAQVAVITPTNNQRHSWHMHTITEIWEGRSPVSKSRIIEYVTDDGLRYLDGGDANEEGSLTRVFSMTAEPSSRT